MNTMVNNWAQVRLPSPANLSEKQLEVLARSGFYNVELQDGRIVDMYSYMYSDTDMSGLLKKLGKFFKKVIHKPLKILPYVAAAYGLGIIGGGVGGTAGAVLKKISAPIKKLIASSNFKQAEALFRKNLVAVGLTLTNAQMQSAMAGLVDQTVWGESYVQPGTYPVAPIVPPIDFNKYLPYILIGGVVLILVLRR